MTLVPPLRVLVCVAATAIAAYAGPAPRIVVSPRPVHKGAARLEKRSREALKTAGTALAAAREEYRAGNADGMVHHARRIEESIDLAYVSLAETGKNPREEPKHFKRAEIEIHQLYRRVEFFQTEMAFEDRPSLDGLKARLRQLQDALLHSLTNGGKMKPVAIASSQ